ncbi:MAG: hypothetical protein RL591_984, partial [Planctomycetota bacterium]
MRTRATTTSKRPCDRRATRLWASSQSPLICEYARRNAHHLWSLLARILRAMRTKKLFLSACSLTLTAHLCNIGCSGESPKPSASAPPTPPASEAAKADADAASKDVTSKDVTSKDVASKDEVKIMKEYWEGTKNLKFWNEMRRDENGRWDRNGIGRAYY